MKHKPAFKFSLSLASLAVPVLLSLCAGCSTTSSSTTASSLGPERRDLATLKQQQADATPAQVLDSLRRGNERFASGKPQARDMLHDQQVTAAGQYPHAVILSCIDSRAPAEFIFDQGIGDLF